MKRVAITGMGCVTPIGIGTESFWESLMHARAGFTPLSDDEKKGLTFSTIARVAGFKLDNDIMADRSSSFALTAAREAIQQSGLLATVDRAEVAVILGCSAGGRTTEEPALAKLYAEGARVHPLTVPRSMPNAGTSLVCIEHGFTGPAYTVSTACSSGAHAIGQAFHLVRSGAVQAAVTGGHDAPLTHGFLQAWNSLRVVSPTFCRPFAKDRDGITLAEGSAMLVLEDMDAANARGAKILGEIVGFGMSSDAQHMTQPKPDGPISAMRRALRDCGSLKGPVRYINAHGTATPTNDSMEAAAIKSVFDADAANIPVSSTKSMHGHAMGASGAIEAVATILAMLHQSLPPTAHSSEIDPALELDIIQREPRSTLAGLALSNSFAFGGLNAVLAFRSI